MIPRATEQERRDAYDVYAAEQINIHRHQRIQWGYDHPNSPNPYELPVNDQQRENNPNDQRLRDPNPANAYIQHLYNSLNDIQRARVAAVNVHEIVPPPLPPVNRVLDYVG